MGLYPKAWGRSITELYDELTGAIPSVVVNEAMQRGTDMEPIARARVNDDFGSEYSPVCVVHREYAELRASLDGYDPTASPPVLEIKSPTSKALLTKAQDGFIPPYYFAQVQHILNVTGEPEARFRVHYETPARHKVETADLIIPAHKRFIERMQRLELDFWENVVYRVRPTETLTLAQHTTLAGRTGTGAARPLSISERAARLTTKDQIAA